MQRHTVIGTLSVMMLAVVVVGVSWSNAIGQAQEVSLTGCLKPGEKDGDFVLEINEKEAYLVQPAEGMELAPHLKHKVEITGIVEKTETSSVLKAKALKMVAESCE